MPADDKMGFNSAFKVLSLERVEELWLHAPLTPTLHQGQLHVPAALSPGKIPALPTEQ